MRYVARKNSLAPLAVLFLVLLLAWGVGCSGKSDEELIRESIGKIGEYAEARELEPILVYLSKSYSDDEGRTAEEIETLLDENFSKYSGIAVNILGTEFISLEPPHAVVETDAAFSSGAARTFRKIIRFSGQCYRFRLELEKEEETWKVQAASWEYISTGELSPESMEIIKEVFPKL